jgi:nitrogen fixation protein NifX
MKIAVASTDGEHVNEHFGWAKQFYLYNVNETEVSPIKLIDSREEYANEQEKLTYKIQSIDEADILFCAQIGPTASKMVLAQKIHPMRIEEGTSIDSALTSLQIMMRANPPIWLMRILTKEQKG